jgi:hypothetical protein
MISHFFRPMSDAWQLERLVPVHEVLVQTVDCPQDDALAYIQTNCRGDWSHDWMHGDSRSDTPEVRAQSRYLFSDQAAAAMFRMRFG